MKQALEKAKILIEALPYIKAFSNKTVVIKYGGHAMVDDALKKSFALDIILLKYIGLNTGTFSNDSSRFSVNIEIE